MHEPKPIKSALTAAENNLVALLAHLLVDITISQNEKSNTVFKIFKGRPERSLDRTPRNGNGPLVKVE